MDCFYAAVHVRDDPSLSGLPVVIGGSPQGRGVVAAASYEARKFGVHSAMPAARAARRCSRLVFIRPDFPRYRRESAEIFAIFRRYTPLVQTVSLDEAYLDVTEHLEPFGNATALAKELRAAVLKERKLTVSVGVGPNRLVAKIASDYDKPDGLTVVPPKKVRRFLDPQPVRRLLGVGPATERALAELGIATIADLRVQSRELLERRFGRHGGGLYRYARGIDERPVNTHWERKSLGHENTYAKDLNGLEPMDAEIVRLVTKVATGLTKRDLSARTVVLKVRYADFTTLTRSRTLAWPTTDPAELAAHAHALLRKTEAEKRPVRLLGVTASGLEKGAAIQLPLFPLQVPPEPSPRNG